MGDVREDGLRPPHGTTAAAMESNQNQILLVTNPGRAILAKVGRKTVKHRRRSKILKDCPTLYRKKNKKTFNHANRADSRTIYRQRVKELGMRTYIEEASV